MNYLKIYQSLINDAKENPKADNYKEIHHIVPKCMGGDDSSENLVKLTARQHYLAHWLLYKIYKTSNLVHAWHAMSIVGVGQDERKINSRLFEYCKKERRKILSAKYSGKGNNFYGKTHTEETKKKISNIHHGKVYKTDQQIKKWVEDVAKQPKSEEHKKKIGRKGLVILQHIHTKEIVRVPSTDEKTLSKEWVNPRKLKPETKHKCKHCDMITTSSNIKRWHNDKCKRKLYEN